MKKLIIIFLSIICVCDCFGQLPNIKFGTNELIESAISDGIYIVRTYYVLKDKKTGNLFGRGGKQYFGSYIAIGYALPDGFVCNEDATAPWLKDKAYDKYRNNENYEPILIDSLYIKPAFNKGDFRSLPLGNSLKLPSTPWIQISTQLSNVDVFHIDTIGYGDLTGWIVWLESSTDTILGQNSQLSMSSANKRLDITDTIKTKIESPIYLKGFVSGLFVIPKITGVGEISLCLKGLLTKEEDSWFIYPIRANWPQAIVKENEKTPSRINNEPDTEELTPVDDKPTPGKRKRIKSKKN
jgi:hypothetical protein